VWQRPIKDMQAYVEKLQQFVYHSGTFMKPLFQLAKKHLQIANVLFIQKVKKSAFCVLFRSLLMRSWQRRFWWGAHIFWRNASRNSDCVFAQALILK
jgi:hypothetical protein